MEMPTAFEARLQDLTGKLEQSKQLLEVQHEIRKAKQKTLEEANGRVEQIRILTSALKSKAEEMAQEISALEDKRSAMHAPFEDYLCQTRMLAEQIIKLEQEKHETSKFYESNKDEMEQYRIHFQEQNLNLENEINVLQVKHDELTRSQNVRKQHMCEMDAAITEEMERRQRLESTKERVVNDIASSSLKVEKLEAAVQQALTEAADEQKLIEAEVRAQKNDLLDLQRQKLHWEHRITQQLHTRACMGREAEVLHRRIEEVSKALCG